MYYYIHSTQGHNRRTGPQISFPRRGRPGNAETTLEIKSLEQEGGGYLRPTDLALLSKRVSINVSGMIFETSYATLQRYPASLLGNPTLNWKYFDKTRNQFYFDRNRTAFECIFFFYQSGGKLLNPQDITAEEFLEELNFFQMGETVIARYTETYCPHLLPAAPVEKEELPKNNLQRKIWLLFDAPDTSQGARAVGIFSVLMILFSILILCIQSTRDSSSDKMNIRDKWGHTPLTDPHNLHLKIEQMEQQQIFPHDYAALSTTSVPKASAKNHTALLEYTTDSPFEEFTGNATTGVNDVLKGNKDETISNFLLLMETVTMSWFAIEYFIRLISCPNKCKFIKSMLNLFDILAVVPFVTYLIINLSGLELDSSKAKALTILRITRLVRVFPIMKLTRHSKNLQILAKTFRSSLNELGLLIFFFSICVIIFSSGVYLAENDKDNKHFTSIPNSFWYSVITMTTVGYGDMCPVTPLGKLVGSMCALVGILTLSLPVPIIVSNFSYHYTVQGKPAGDSEGSTIGDTLQRYSMMSPHIRRGKDSHK